MGVVGPNVGLLHLTSTKFKKSITSVPGYVQYKTLRLTELCHKNNMLGSQNGPLSEKVTMVTEYP